MDQENKEGSKPKRTIDPSAIERLRSDLASLPPKSKTSLTARDVVTALAPDLRSKLATEGYSLSNLAEHMSARGVPISASTLGTYLRAIASQEQPGKPGVRSRVRRETSAQV